MADVNLFKVIKQTAVGHKNKFTLVYFVTCNDTSTFNLLYRVNALYKDKLDVVIIGDSFKNYTKSIIKNLNPTDYINDNFYCNNSSDSKVRKLFIKDMNAVFNEEDFIAIQPNGALFILDCKGQLLMRFYQDFWHAELTPFVQHLKPKCNN